MFRFVCEYIPASKFNYVTITVLSFPNEIQLSFTLLEQFSHHHSFLKVQSVIYLLPYLFPCDINFLLIESIYPTRKMMQHLSRNFLVVGLLMTTALPWLTEGGIISYGICQTGCNAVAVACYAAAGFTFGVPTWGAAIPAALVSCNNALGVCMTVCALVIPLPAP
jgi:hypothetical protein